MVSKYKNQTKLVWLFPAWFSHPCARWVQPTNTALHMATPLLAYTTKQSSWTPCHLLLMLTCSLAYTVRLNTFSQGSLLVKVTKAKLPFQVLPPYANNWFLAPSCHPGLGLASQEQVSIRTSGDEWSQNFTAERNWELIFCVRKAMVEDEGGKKLSLITRRRETRKIE